MIFKLDSGSAPSKTQYDVIIIGTGPSGVILANELAASRSGIRICVLESGMQHSTDFTDGLKMVTWDSMRIKETSRERVLGGAATTWCGLSAPFDTFELGRRPYLDSPGWPLTRHELDAYYRQASERYRFPHLHLFMTDETNEWHRLSERGDIQPRWDKIVEKPFFAAVNPQRFAQEHAHLFEGNSVDLYLGASVKKLFWNDDGDTASVHSALAMDSDGVEHLFRAESYVLCTGGIENARIMLNSTNGRGESLGNGHDQVGRYLMNHPKCYECTMDLSSPICYLPYYFGAMWQGFSGYAGFRLADEIQSKNELVNAYVRLEPLFPWSDNRGVESLIYLVKRTRYLFKFWKKINFKKIVELRSYAETGDETDIDEERPSLFELFLSILGNLPTVLHYSWHRVFKRPVIRRIRLCSFMEMEPHRDNRITLGEERDAHGYPLPHVSYMVTERDIASLIELTRTLARELEQENIGQLNLGDLEDERFFKRLSTEKGVDASHHMGCTRMGANPENSVVDENQKVHNVTNLYVNGSSVFPTSGVSNPTYTIAALSIRLAEHFCRHVLPKTTQE